MNLHQINMSFDAVQDRLLLKVSTTDDGEMRFWLTRRLLLLAWPQVVKTLDTAPVPVMGAPAKPSAPLEFRHAAAVEKADFATPYAAEGKTQLAPEPMLVSRFSLKPLGGDRYQLMLGNKEQAGATFVLPATLFHGFVKLLQDTAKAADWGLAMNMPMAVMASSAIN